jgi:hypothetical protein
VAIDGQIFLPDANELGWKETVRMNPGQDVILAVRAVSMTLPWKIGVSVRPMEPSVPVGGQFMDANGTMVTNTIQNYGWEYVWHCHLLGHEENDMMRPQELEFTPAAPAGLTALAQPGTQVDLTWVNNATANPAATSVTIERATDAGFTTGVTTFSVPASATTYSDTSVTAATTYYYHVRAENTVAYSTWSVSASATTP